MNKEHKSKIGGQALIEGVMMRGIDKASMAVRKSGQRLRDRERVVRQRDGGRLFHQVGSRREIRVSKSPHHQTVFDYAEHDDQRLKNAAQLFGLLHGQAVIFDDEYAARRLDIVMHFGNQR